MKGEEDEGGFPLSLCSFSFIFSSVSRERREILCVGEKSDRILVGG